MNWIHVSARECEWFGGGGGGALRELMDSNKYFPVMSTVRIIVLVVFEILRHMLDFRSSVSCLGFG